MTEVKIKVDLDRREKLRRLHTVTHIVNYCAREVLGNHVWQNGSNLKPEFGTLDITHYENLSRSDLKKIELMTNKVIFQDRKVSIEEIPRDEAEKNYGFTVYQGGAIPMSKIRIIKVLDNDIEACGGIHMESTGGIGMVKIIDSQKIQDGVVRLKYVVESYALEHTQIRDDVIYELEKLYDVSENDILKTSEKFFEDWKVQKKRIENLEKSLIQSNLNIIKESSDIEFNVGSGHDMGFMMDLFNQANKTKDKLMIESDKFIISTPDFNIEDNKYSKKIEKPKFNIHIK